MDLALLARDATHNLEAVIAIDSQSDERSETIPSTEGQRVLAGWLGEFFGALGLASTIDDDGNLMVTVPASAGCEAAPRLALMVHVDTARGTLAVPHLERVPAWDGSELTYPDNPRLHVSVADYPELACFAGEDVLHGPGAAPVGLDDKLGMSQLMTLAQQLVANEALPHGELRLVFRPDEEIGRMEAVEGLAGALAAAGVTHGYTVDGIEPFEVNVENFNAARTDVVAAGQVLLLEGEHRAEVVYRVEGVKSHGATAKAEGYRNAIRLVAEALGTLPSPSIAAVDFATDPLAETSADVTFGVAGADAVALDRNLQSLDAALSATIGRHERRGAFVTRASGPAPPAGPWFDSVSRLLEHLGTFVETRGDVAPLWSEESAGFEGYSNPHEIERQGDTWRLAYRLRDFDPAALAARAAHVEAAAVAHGLPVTTKNQYKNMGPDLAGHPELLEWALTAAAQVDVQANRRPIRGGTGVDPFLVRGIPVANVGTGYFAPESEKELTTAQHLGRHVAWLIALVGEVART